MSEHAVNARGTSEGVGACMAHASAKALKCNDFPRMDTPVVKASRPATAARQAAKAAGAARATPPNPRPSFCPGGWPRVFQVFQEGPAAEPRVVGMGWGQGQGSGFGGGI